MKNLLTPMISFIKKNLTILFATCLVLGGANQMMAQTYEDKYPNVVNAITVTGEVGGAVCSGSSVTLTATTVNTNCTTGTGTNITTFDPVTVNWYDNGTTNSTVGGSLVSTSSATAATTSWIYSPTPTVGQHYYYCVVTWTNGNPLATCDNGNAIGIKPAHAVLVTVNAAPTAVAGTPVTTCSNAPPVNITAGASATNHGTITWTSGGTGTITNPNSLTLCTYTPSAGDIIAGTVSFTLTVNGISPCGTTTDTKTLTIQNNAPTSVAGPNDTTCSNSGAVNITAGSSATNQSSVTWTSSGTGSFTNANSLTLCTYTPSAADIGAGHVTLTLTANGNSPCGNTTSTKLLVINKPATAVAGTGFYMCSNAGSANVTAGSSATRQSSVTWTSSGTGSFTNANSLTLATYFPSVADITAGQVTLTLTAFGISPCGTTTSNKTLYITTGPTAFAGPNDTTCANSGAVNITAGSSVTNRNTITWSSSGTGTFQNPNSPTLCKYTPSLTDISAGNVTITLTATGNSPCANVTSSKLLVINPLPIAVAGTPITTCGSGPVNITAGSSATNQSSVTWTSSGTGSFTNANSLTLCTYSPSVADISAGHVTLQLKALGEAPCAADSTTKTLTIASMTATATISSAISCGGGTGSVIANPTGGSSPYTYAWSDASSQSNATATGLTAGTYSVLVSDNGGCTVTASVSLTQPAALYCGIYLAHQQTCVLGYLTVTAGGGTAPYTYLWSDASSQTTATCTGLSAGTYTVFVTDAGGCNSNTSSTITYNPLIGGITSTVQNLCAGGAGGSATVSPTGGRLPYTYSWSNGGSGAHIAALTDGTYSVTVTDINGCTLTASVAITSPPVLTLSPVSETGPSCHGGSDGSITVSASGGVAPYTYVWTPNVGATPTVSGLSARGYSILLKDNNGCTAQLNYSLTQPTAVTTTISHAGCNLTANPSGGTSPYVYSWSDGATTATITETNGTYTVTTTDNNGCNVTASGTVTSCPSELSQEHKSPKEIGGSSTDNVSSITVYPNPSSGQFTIAGLESGMIIEMYDYTGRMVSTITASNNTMQLNISERANGIYLIRVLSEDGTLISQQKLMKTN